VHQFLLTWYDALIIVVAMLQCQPTRPESVLSTPGLVWVWSASSPAVLL
jgi:hypothetical protein